MTSVSLAGAKLSKREMSWRRCFDERNRRLLALWNTGDYTQAQIGGVFGLRAGRVDQVLRQARVAGLEVLTIDAAERGRRAGRSRRLWRDGRSETGVETPEASQQLRVAWLSGVSAVRIAVMLGSSEPFVRSEARRLGLPPQRKWVPRSAVCPNAMVPSP